MQSLMFVQQSIGPCSTSVAGARALVVDYLFELLFLVSSLLLSGLQLNFVDLQQCERALSEHCFNTYIPEVHLCLQSHSSVTLSAGFLPVPGNFCIASQIL
jgi:hypothetical protein